MFKISEHIYNELKDSDIVIEKIEFNKKKEILDMIFDKYINCNIKSTMLWEKFIHSEAINDDMAWSYIKDFINDNECIMFFNQDEEKEMFLIRSGWDLNFLLSETYGFEFYITNMDCLYLLCFSHHDILYGCGIAEEWIKKMKKDK